MRELRRLGRSAAGVLVAGALVVGVAACGGDDDEEATGDTTTTTEAATGGESEEESETEAPASASGASAEFCDGLVAFNDGVSQAQVEPGASPEDVMAVGDRIVPLWDQVRDNAPEELAADLEPLSAAIDPLTEGDATAFSADETFQEYTVFVGKAIDACEFETTSVTAVDYAFEGVPATMPAGTVAVEMANESEGEEHEFLVVRKNDPAQPAEEILALPEDQIESAVTFVGGAFAPPGETGSSLLTLEPGAYLAVCTIPVGGTEEGPPHFTEGMLTEFTVG